MKHKHLFFIRINISLYEIQAQHSNMIYRHFNTKGDLKGRRGTRVENRNCRNPKAQVAAAPHAHQSPVIGRQ